jgi:hypothetical protein
MTMFRPFPTLATVVLGLSLTTAGCVPVSAQYYQPGYAFDDDRPDPRVYPRRNYGPPPGYYGDRPRYGDRGYRGQAYEDPGFRQGGVYFDRETAKRNARALKEQQKAWIKSGRGGPPPGTNYAPQQNYAQPGRGGGRGYPPGTFAQPGQVGQQPPGP